MAEDDEKKKRYVVYVGVKGEPEGKKVASPGLPVFRKGVPRRLPELTAKQLVERAQAKVKADLKANKVAKSEPAFRYATAAESKATRKAEEAAAEASATAAEAEKEAGK